MGLQLTEVTQDLLQGGCSRASGVPWQTQVPSSCPHSWVEGGDEILHTWWAGKSSMLKMGLGFGDLVVL